jgi:release factor glutamine methyltransferase
MVKGEVKGGANGPRILDFFRTHEKSLPRHELELLLEAAYSAEFKDRPRLGREVLAGLVATPEGQWLKRAEGWVQQRVLERIPVQHLTRQAWFFGRSFEVGPEVLVPRPETEVLVFEALAALRGMGSGPLRGAEIGVGSGAISVTLLVEEPRIREMIGSELELEAHAVAQRNAEKAGVKARLELVEAKPGQVCGPLLFGGEFDFLVSNPPYLGRDLREVEPEVMRFEPESALFAPEGDLLYFYREIAQGAGKVLKNGGKVWLEVPHERAAEIVGLFSGFFDETSSGKFTDVGLIRDLSGRDRVLAATWHLKS